MDWTLFNCRAEHGSIPKVKDFQHNLSKLVWWQWHPRGLWSEVVIPLASGDRRWPQIGVSRCGRKSWVWNWTIDSGEPSGIEIVFFFVAFLAFLPTVFDDDSINQRSLDLLWFKSMTWLFSFLFDEQNVRLSPFCAQNKCRPMFLLLLTDHDPWAMA